MRQGTFVAAIAVSLALAGCGAHRSDHTVSYHTVSAARAGITDAELDVQSGATSITVESVPLGSGLYRVSTPPDSRLTPSVRRKHGRVRVSLNGPGGRSSSVKIEVADAVVWRLAFNGGATDVVADFRGGKLAGLDLVAGDADATLTLPRPAGSVTITEQGGLSRLAVRVAGNAPVQLKVGGGAAKATIDGVTHTGVAAGSVLSSPGWNTAHDRYDLLAKGGVSSLSVSRL